MKNTGKIFKNLALITQLGLQVMVPIALCVAIGVIIDNHFGTCWVIPLMIIGMLAGGRNAYRLAMASAKDDEKEDSDNRDGRKDIDGRQR